MEPAKMRFISFTKALVASATALALSSPVYAQTVLESVTANGKLTVATEVAYPPMEYLEDGVVVGYGKDILDLVVDVDNLLHDPPGHLGPQGDGAVPDRLPHR